jgi:soluble lytic murein transglycosylase-like protein
VNSYSKNTVVLMSLWVCTSISFANELNTLQLESVKASNLALQYVPSSPSIIKTEWVNWVAKADEIIATVVNDPKARVVSASDILYEAQRSGLEPEFLFALVEVVSKFRTDSNIKSEKIGLLGISSKLHQKLGNPENSLYQPKYNLRIGTSILRARIDQVNGDVLKGLRLFLQDTSGANLSPTQIRNTWMARRELLSKLAPKQ